MKIKAGELTIDGHKFDFIDLEVYRKDQDVFRHFGDLPSLYYDNTLYFSIDNIHSYLDESFSKLVMSEEREPREFIADVTSPLLFGSMKLEGCYITYIGNKITGFATQMTVTVE